MEILDIITIILLIAILVYLVDFGYKCTVEGFKKRVASDENLQKDEHIH